MKKIKVIVTGGCGFIGSHLVDRLVNMNYEVHVVDDLSAVSNDKFYFNPNAKYHKESIMNREMIENIFTDVKIVFHLAAESRIQTAIINPEYAYTVNLLGTFSILEASKKFGVEKFILSSTSSVYGLTDFLPTSEENALNCLNPYSLSKFFSEELSRQYTNCFSVVIFRYFNVFGERSPNKGMYAPVVGIFLNQLANNQPLTIVGDGNQRRDFVHVDDVVSANILAAKSDNYFSGDIFNVGSGKNYSINEISKAISKNFINLPFREGEAKNTLADISKISKFLGFKPTTDIIDWINKKLQNNNGNNNCCINL